MPSNLLVLCQDRFDGNPHLERLGGQASGTTRNLIPQRDAAREMTRCLRFYPVDTRAQICAIVWFVELQQLTHTMNFVRRAADGDQGAAHTRAENCVVDS